jgi:hypothetical protein
VRQVDIGYSSFPCSIREVCLYTEDLVAQRHEYRVNGCFYLIMGQERQWRTTEVEGFEIVVFMLASILQSQSPRLPWSAIGALAP